MKHYYLTISLFLISLCVVGQVNNRIGYAFRTYDHIKIDGKISEACWDKAEVLGNFRQFDPFYDGQVTFQTEVRIIYDDASLYVAAIMYDTYPDSILMQLGNRDAILNADAFGIKIDTYNKQNDAYVFEVSASGVQSDYRDNDLNFNAVWESAVQINNNSWVVEMRIPYSAIRFPKTDKQTWRLQLYRNFRRKREWTQWALENRSATNKKAYWGELHGIENINPPVRLSLSPYMTMHGEHYPYNIENKSNLSQKTSGGVDLKFGIGESHTLDMTLLPDFSQVQSDNQIKNLTAFETVYDEKRPFFQESVDLFSKGSLFYSRRIGRTPIDYYKVNSQLIDKEYIINNPYQSKLLNATKFSGRDKKGLALGIFNAITDNTYALIGDSANGQRKILTDPMTNYSIIVADKAFKNSSSIYIINTNVYRKGDFNSSNVSGSGINLLNNKNTYTINLSGAQSIIFSPEFLVQKKGYYYYMNAGKIKGNFLFNIWRSVTDDKFDKNDMGILHINSQIANGTNINYNIYEPFYKFMNLRTRLTINYNTHFLTHKPTTSRADFFILATTNKYMSLWGTMFTSLSEIYDYYEARQSGRVYLSPKSKGASFNFSSDYRRTIAIDGGIEFNTSQKYNIRNNSFYLEPIVRVNDRFSFNHRASVYLNRNNIGYAGKDSISNVYFGQRNLQTIENIFSGLYILKNDLSFSLRARYYWVIGEYKKYYMLLNNGKLEETNYSFSDMDFNFNSLNIDMVFNWQFAPGSNLSIIWKNALLEESNNIIYNFADNFTHTLSYPQLNTLTIKFLYYLDYVNIKKKFSSS